MTSFNRVLLLALLYLAVLTAAAPVLDDNESSELGALEARGGSKGRPASRPKPRPAPRPARKPVVKKPVPVHVPPKKAPVRVPPKTHVPVHVPPKKTSAPVRVPVQPGSHPTVPGVHTTVPHGNTTLPHGKSCPLPPKTTKKTKPREIIDYVSSFFFTKRANPEFIGWHGTNSDTAEVWTKARYLEKPWKLWDIVAQRRTGGSGADQELGSGVYVTESLTTAQGFADINAMHNPGTQPTLCAIFAYDSDTWRTRTPKAWLPNNIIGDAADAAEHKHLEDTRLAWIQRVFPTVAPNDVVRFAPLDRNRGLPPGQLVIPGTRTNQFYASCVIPAGGGRVPNGAPTTDIDYDTKRTEWHILDTPCV